MATLDRAITTQEELDAVIGDRLKRERETSAKKYEGWMSPEKLKELTDAHAAEIKKLTDAAADTEKKLAEKDAAIAESAKYRTDLEKTRIALAAGLKIDYADRLRGKDADEWKADAELLAKDFAGAHHTPPMGNPDPTPGGDNPGAVAQEKFIEWLDNFDK